MAKIDRIINSDLCLGCGLCSAIDANCKMVINSRGFYRPQGVSDKHFKKLSKLCPGIYLKNQYKSKTYVWGNIISVKNAWSKDKKIRYSSSSGGVTTTLAIYLLEKGLVDGILHVGQENGNYLHNRLFISRTKENVISRSGSRYAPAMMFDNIFSLLDEHPLEKYAFIGKPCDIACIQSIKAEYPQYANRILYTLSIFCAGMPSYKATEKAIKALGNVTSSPIHLNYRGDGWPGFFSVDYVNGTNRKMSYNDSWGKILGRDLGFRCKICPDGIGLQADISSGDSWNTKDGYPDFTESDGKNFCFIRSDKGNDLFENACKDGFLECEDFEISEVKNQQKYQYTRRHYVGCRILVVQFFTMWLLNFHGMNTYKLAMKANLLLSLKEILGTVKRFKDLTKHGEHE